MTDRIMKPTAELVPLYQDGVFHFDRHFDPMTLDRLVGDDDQLSAIEAEQMRHAYRSAAEQSLTVLSEEHKGWTDVGERGRIYAIRLRVRHEPQALDRLIFQVSQRLARDPELWSQGPSVIPSPVLLARAAVLAVRDLGRLTAAVPRPESLPE